MRKKYSASYKSKVALEAIRGDLTIAELSGKYGVHANQISKWKKQALVGLPQLFSDKRKKEVIESEELVSELYRTIGRLNVELEWLKKKSGLVD
jgi:transposase-like protein